ncbi:uncharacterized protein LOC130623662 [Hydractinia symbiolongicarpus]|uniref:uncharacterized protein LOC130623662 n=1 Tax=Hydractinia symbiolongicarpus TaxID=13093 RepID=UPI00254F97FF|nr:uncharacterized protein LOC130623662 [Hydractinia symbiolongicarpus]
MQHVKRIEELLENRCTFTKCTLASLIDDIALPFPSIDVDEENIGEVLTLPNTNSKVGRCLIQEVLPNRMTPSSSVDDVQLIVNDGDVDNDSCSIISFDSISSLPISEVNISDGCLIQELFLCRNISITSFGNDNIAKDSPVEIIKPADLDQIASNKGKHFKSIGNGSIVI